MLFHVQLCKAQIEVFSLLKSVLMTSVTPIADLNEFNTELQFRLFLVNVINQTCNLSVERNIPYTTSHEILLEFSSTPWSAPPSEIKSEAKIPPKMPDIELSHETNVNEVVNDGLEISVELLLNRAEKPLRPSDRGLENMWKKI